MKNRRRGPDALVRLITIFSVCTWLVIVVVFALYGSSKPVRSSSYFYRHAEATGRGIPIVIAKLLLVINLILCVWGIIANIMRNRRKSDRLRVSLVVSTIITFVAFVYFMVMM
jgi:4-oxalocrotonate tautomerase